MIANAGKSAAIRMIAVDMDGTLLGEGGVVSERNLRAIRAAEAVGVEVVVATGRRHCYAMRQLRGLGMRDEATLVSSNGTVTRTIGHGLVDRRKMSRETAEWLIAKIGDYRDSLVVTFDKVGDEDGEDEVGALVVEETEQLHASVGNWMEANARYIERVQPIERALEMGEPIQMMVCGTPDRMRLAEAQLLGDARVLGVGEPMRAGVEIVLNRTEYPARNLSILDILPAGCSKGMALLRLADGWGIRPEQMMAIGDNWNDLSMLEVAGWPVLMANAPEDLLRLAGARGWTVTGTNLEDGVAQAVERAMGLRPKAAEEEPVAALPVR